MADCKFCNKHLGKISEPDGFHMRCLKKPLPKRLKKHTKKELAIMELARLIQPPGVFQENRNYIPYVKGKPKY